MMTDAQNFGDYTDFDLIGEQQIELAFGTGEQSKLAVDNQFTNVYRRYFRSETSVNVADSTW